MNNVALFVKIEAIRGKEAEVEEFLEKELSLVEDEPDTTNWYAMKLGPSTFAIFDTFPDEKCRRAHLAGNIARALITKAPDLFSCTPSIEEVEILAARVPELEHQ